MLLFRLKKQTSTNVANTTFKVSEYLILLKAKSTVSFTRNYRKTILELTAQISWFFSPWNNEDMKILSFRKKLLKNSNFDVAKRNYFRMITYINNEKQWKKVLNIFLYLFASQDLLHTISFIMHVIIDITYIITIRA